jgi:hypothetical protein
MMTCKGYGSKRSRHNLRYYPRICVEVLRKTTKNLIRDVWFLGRDLNPGPPEHGTGVVTTSVARSSSMLSDTTLTELPSSSETFVSNGVTTNKTKIYKLKLHHKDRKLNPGLLVIIQSRMLFISSQYLKSY